MSWDDTKIANDDFLAADWNSMVTDQKGRGKISSQENKTGADCSGTDGDALRVLTLANTEITKDGGIFVFVNGLFQHSTQITITHIATETTIKFTDKLWDTDKIAVVYMT